MTRTVLIALPAGMAGGVTADGKPIPTPALPLKGREQGTAASDASATATPSTPPDLKPSPSRGGLGGDGLPPGNDATPWTSATGQKIAAEAAPTSSEEHTSELQSLMRISYAVFSLKKKTNSNTNVKI